MQALYTISTASWEGPFSSATRDQALEALEQGKVLFLPDLAFRLENNEIDFLSPQTVHRSKNVSFDPGTGKAGGTAVCGLKLQELCGLMNRFARASRALVDELLPAYQQGIQQARTSFRPVEIEGRQSSWRKDDTRLHVDSFPSMPTGGKRILRVFSNVNHQGKPRIWRLGETFDTLARRFWPTLRPPKWGEHLLMYLLRVSRTMRTPYDTYMLQLHDRMKEDQDYQTCGQQMTQAFPPGSSWIVFTDQVPHAAMSGIHQLEQTFYVPNSCLRHPTSAPLQVLEGLAGRKLA